MQSLNYSVILSLIILVGCSERMPFAPAQAIEELKTLGITISSDDDLPGTSFRGKCSTTGNYVSLSGAFALYFSPHNDYSTAFDFSQTAENNFDAPLYLSFNNSFPYQYSFSTESAGSIIEIPPYDGDISDYLQTIGHYETPDTYSGEIRPESALSGFILYGDHYLKDPIFSIPANATHVELKFRETIESENFTLYRTALDNLISWRYYIEPLLTVNEAGVRVCSDENVL